MLHLKLYGMDGGSADSDTVPVSDMFRNIGKNILNTFSHNNGMNFIGAAAATHVFIETGWDWKWRDVPYRNTWIADGGRPGLYIGYVIPAIAPVTAYLAGRTLKNEKLQIAGVALAQSVLLTTGIQSSLKMISGRALPGIVADLDHARDSRTNDFSGEFNWFNMNPIGGWPSSHTASAFAAAATIAEIYDDSLILKIVAYSYAALIGFGVTLNVHWASDAVAGALMGYAIGKTVGRSFSGRPVKTERKNAISFYGSPSSVGVRIRW
ncbi:MAG: phosphatase PAP2 family protein [Spirochaetaceae bacterium]|nr:phosphatase PAP2 family protein [Spirochaetaceae bacterium]